MSLEDILTQAASATEQMTPKPSGSLTTMGPTPTGMPSPLPTFRPPPVQYGQAGNEFHTASGRKRADQEALFHGIANLINQGTQYLQAKKQRSLQMDITTLLQAQEGIREAQISGDQEGIVHNTEIINTITSDTKKLKQLQKAFNIDLFGTSNKNKMENQALLKAWTDWHKKKSAGDTSALNPAAQRLLQMQPWRQQISPEISMQAGLMKSGFLPKANELLQAYQKNYQTLMKAQTDTERTAAIKDRNKILEDNAKLIAGAKDRQTEAYIRRTLEAHQTSEDKFRTELEIQKLRSSSIDNRTQILKDISEGKNKVLEDKISSEKKISEDKTKPALVRSQAYSRYVDMMQQKNKVGMITQQVNNLVNYKKTLVAENTKYLAELDKKGSTFFGLKAGAMSAQDAAQARIKMQVNTKIMQDVDSQIQELQGRANIMNITQQSIAGEDMSNKPSALVGPGSTESNPITFVPDNGSSTNDISDEN